MKRIFVTGAGGFVGARACRFLQGNYEVLTRPKGWMASCTELQLMQSIAEAQPDVIPVSYTHLDVYKRQLSAKTRSAGRPFSIR